MPQLQIHNLFLQAACAEVGLREICQNITARYDFTYDLSAILSRLVYGRVLKPASKRATCKFSTTLIEQPDFEEHQVYRALELLAQENDFIQAKLYTNTAKSIKRKTGILYYDCTNFFFETEKEDGFRKYGRSKEHRPNPLVQMGLFMDAEGMPLAFEMFAGNESEQTSMCPLEKKIAADFSLSKFIACTDAGLSSLANRRFNMQGDRQFVMTQSVKKLKAHLKTWALDPSGWSVRGKESTFNLLDVERIYNTDDTACSALRSMVFYKQRRMREKDKESKGGWFEQELIVTFSFKHRDYQRSVRNAQIERAARAIDKDTSRMDRKGSHDFRRLCKKTSVTQGGEGWRPMYVRNEITDALHDAFGFRTDYEILTNAEMKRIIKKPRALNITTF